MDITKPCRDTQELSERAQKALSLFLQMCEEKCLNVLVTETYRSQERQNYLYEQGRTRPGNIVTWTRSSNHTSRMAWDICKNIRGQEYSDANFFNECGKIAKELGITWGGTWKQKDTPHFQIDSNWKEPNIDTDYIEAINKLVAKGIISSPTIWEQENYTKDNVKSLIKKISDKLN